MVIAGAGVLISAYFIFFRDRDDLIYLLGISLLALVIGYTFQYQIDQLMIRGVPQRLDPAMRQMLLQTTAQFAVMPPAQQALVEDRIQRWVIRKDWVNKNEQDAPEDVKYILAWYAILLTLRQESYMYPGIDRFVFYHHPFLTPRHMDDAHIAEVEQEDGTVIISVPHLIKGHMEKGYYNLALHVMAETYAVCYLKSPVSWPEDIWSQLESISSISRAQIEAYIGLPVADPWPVAVHHHFTYAGAHIPEVAPFLPWFTKEKGQSGRQA